MSYHPVFDGKDFTGLDYYLNIVRAYPQTDRLNRILDFVATIKLNLNPKRILKTIIILVESEHELDTITILFNLLGAPGEIKLYLAIAKLKKDRIFTVLGDSKPLLQGLYEKDYYRIIQRMNDVYPYRTLIMSPILAQVRPFQLVETRLEILDTMLNMI